MPAVYHGLPVKRAGTARSGLTQRGVVPTPLLHHSQPEAPVYPIHGVGQFLSIQYCHQLGDRFIGVGPGLKVFSDNQADLTKR
jgi:hypothetical protein